MATGTQVAGATNISAERKEIVNWFEGDFKESAMKSTKTSRLDDGRVRYSFSVTNNSGYDFSRFSFKVKILNKADGKEIGSATINAGAWAPGEKKNFKSNIDIPEDVKSISFVMYSESISYDGQKAPDNWQDMIQNVAENAGDFVHTGTDGSILGELFGMGGMPGTTTTTRTTTTKSSGQSSTGSTQYSNQYKTYNQRKSEKKLNKMRAGKSGWTVAAFTFAVCCALAALGSYVQAEIIGYLVAAIVSAICGVGFKIIYTNKAKRIRMYEAKINRNGNTSLEELSNYVGRNIKKVADDLQQMVVDGFFPEGYVDIDNGLFVMTRNGEPIEDVATSVAANKKAKRQAARNKGKVPDTIEDLITMTDDDEIKGKLKGLQTITDKIDERVAEVPKMEAQVKDFREKYYPEVVRLTDQYNEKIANLDAADNDKTVSETELHATTKSLAEQAKEIKTQLIKLIDSVQEASENLLEKLHEDDIMDITTDIKSLQTTLASKGLLDSDFDVKL